MLAKLLPMNEGTLDRAARVILGLGALSLVFIGPQTPFGWLGLIFIATGLMGTCPIYTALGLKT